MTDQTSRNSGPMGPFERYLTVWVALAMIAGIGIGTIAPGLVNAIASAEVASINLVVALLILSLIHI